MHRLSYSSHVALTFCSALLHTGICVNSIRGTVDGHVRGFDKHFNLLLTDVDETYTPSAPPSALSRHTGAREPPALPRTEEEEEVLVR